MTQIVTQLLGLVECTNDAYHASAGVSKSHLDAIHAASPRHYWHSYVNPDREPSERTAAMIMGSAVHSAILEPDLFPSEYAQQPTGIDRRTTVGKNTLAQFELENAGKTIISADDYATCLKIRDAVYSHPMASSLLTGGKSEQTFYATDTETGALIKCRVDYLHDSGGMIVDVKTTENASPEGFGKSAASYRYPLQPAWYNGVFDTLYSEHPRNWVFLAVEKKPPFAVGIYFMSPDDTPMLLDAAHEAARRDFMKIIECRQNDSWPDYGMKPQALTLPGWSKL